ncbi:MAG: serine/threonine protein kinase [Clostridia bacterium]|nr:serine/threonine protein kinase [Clostridia bacterium]
MVISKDSIIYDNNKEEYKVEERIGGGGFSSVFKIKKIDDGEYYALKTFSSDFADKIELETFKNEISKSMQVESKNTVKYLFFNDGEIFSDLPPYIIMEYCNGGTLEGYMEDIKNSENVITNEELKKIYSQLINGMKDINSKVIHRDIKLKNILLKDGIIKIGDFGISKSVSETTRTMTFKGYGTKEYISPEGWKFEKNTIKMDIYSMGIVFYQIATLLNYPYKIQNGTADEYRNAHLYGSVTNPRSYNKDIEFNIETTILRMLEKEPNKRFSNWEEIQNQIAVEKNNKNLEILDRILKKRIAIDEKNRKIEIENTKRQEAINERKKTINYSIYENIYIPIKELIDDFNKLYASGKINITDYSVSTDTFSNIRINTISSKRIEIEIHSIVDKIFKRERQDQFFGNIYEEEYRPMLKGKEILAWGMINYADELSYNLILVNDNENIYGKWYQLKNSNSAFNQIPRTPEIFAFEFNEIEKELHYINVMHIYNSVLEEYNKDEMIENMEKII